MKKIKLKTKSKLIIAIMALAMTLTLTVGYGFAWFVRYDEAKTLKLQVTKIDSEIYLSQGIDSNCNGIPNLLSRYSSDDQKKYGYPDTVTKAEYYKETKAFMYNGMLNALSTDVETTESLNYDLGTMYPSQIKTLKFSIVNNSDGNNDISFSFKDKTYTSEKEINLLSCMSIRIGKVTNNTLTETDESKYNLDSSDISVEFSDKYYFMDNIKDTSYSEKSLFDDTDKYEVKGILNHSEKKNDQVLDLWVQFEMETYDELKKHNEKLSMTEEQYQAVSGTKIDFPDINVILELRLTD